MQSLYLIFIILLIIIGQIIGQATVPEGAAACGIGWDGGNAVTSPKSS